MDGLLIKRGGGGGVDISDTTATAEDVTEGKIFYTSSGIKTLGTMQIDKETAKIFAMPSSMSISVVTEVSDI